MKKEIKQQSRRKTGKIVSGTWGMRKFEIPNKFCKICKKNKNLEIHHEIYPRSSIEIKRAISNNRIYYLCTTCHRASHTKGKDL